MEFNLTSIINALTGNKPSAPVKKAAAAVDGYEAAAFSRDRSRIYTSSPETDANPSNYTRREVLNISRYAVKNFPIAERILSVTEIYGIGPGLIANAATQDKVFNKAATATFDVWAGTSFCSASNQYNLYEIQKLLARELVLAGEVFVVLVKSPSGYPQLMPVKSENVRHSGRKEDKSIDGLYVDEFGKVTAYNIHKGGAFQKVDASNVIHLIRHKDIDQLRGVGSFAASLNSLRDRKDCIDLEKKAVKIHSRIAVAVEKKGGELQSGLAGGDDIRLDSANGITTEASNRRLETPFGEGVVLDVGESLKLLSSERSTDGFQSFLELLVREVCLNISLPYEFLVNAEKLTGTAVRFAISDAAFFFRDVQDRILDGAMNRIYAWVIASFINSGKLAAPTKGLPWEVSFTRPLSITVDTQRVSNADIALLQNGLLTFESYYSSRGRDWQQELTQRAEEEAFLDELSKRTKVPIARLRTLAAGSPAIEAAAVEEDVTPANERPVADEEEAKAA